MDKTSIKSMVKEWLNGPTGIKQRCVYENDSICVSHLFMKFPKDKSVEAVMIVQMLKSGKCYRVESGATLIPEDSPNYIK